MRIQIIIAVAMVIVLLASFNAVRKQKIDLRHALSWMACMVIILVLDLFPGLIEWLANLVGIELPINLIFFFGICICLLLVYEVTTLVSKLTDRVKKLTQEVALLEKKLMDKEEK